MAMPWKGTGAPATYDCVCAAKCGKRVVDLRDTLLRSYVFRCGGTVVDYMTEY